VPFISGEEDKLETEAQKILGKVNGDVTGLQDQTELRVSAACNRVPPAISRTDQESSAGLCK
jgi:aspartate-semialdehyde dehydrogenase